MWIYLSSWQAGVTGFCMGGALAIASSVLVPHVDAVVAFYGVPPPELADPAQAKAPIQAHFGELDNFVGFSDVTVWLWEYVCKVLFVFLLLGGWGMGFYYSILSGAYIVGVENHTESFQHDSK